MEKDDLLDKGYAEDSLEEIPSVMEIQPTLRARFWEIMLAALACMFFVYLLKQFQLMVSFLILN